MKNLIFFKFKNFVREKIGIVPSDVQLKKFEIYLNELIFWNKKINLTSIIESDKILFLHFADSLMGISEIKNKHQEKKLIDIGTGGGFPGIPIKIVLPEIKLTLVESNRRKCFFLENIIKKLRLENMEIVWARAETLGRRLGYREDFDIAVSRAIDETSTLLELTSPFVKIDGKVVLWKTANELNNLKYNDNMNYLKSELGIKYLRELNYTLPEQNLKRYLFVFRKEEKTKDKYPRRPGIPHKYPL